MGIANVGIMKMAQLFEPACLVYLLLDVWPLAKLADLFPKEGVKNPFLGK
jgi:hypothetical protein